MIARKVSHCSKNVGGADAFSAFTSVIRTLARNGGDHSLVNGLCGVFSGAPVPHPFLLNPSSHSAPLINYRGGEAAIAYRWLSSDPTYTTPPDTAGEDST